MYFNPHEEFSRLLAWSVHPKFTLEFTSAGLICPGKVAKDWAQRERTQAFPRSEKEPQGWIMSYSRISAVPMLTLGIMLATGTVVGAQSVNSSRNNSDFSRHERACSDRTLFGDYGAKLEGTV